MKLLYHGHPYNSNEMIAIQLHVGGFPTVYVSRDFAAFILLGFDQGTGVTTRGLSPEEFRALGRIYDVPELHAIISDLNKHGAEK